MSPRVHHALRERARWIGEWRRAIVRVRLQYVRAHGRRPRLLAPRRYTEKMQWRKIFDLDPVFATLSDKLAVRDYISARIGDEHLVPLLWWGGRAVGIPFSRLQPPYVLKSTHGSGHVAMVRRKSDVDVGLLRARAATWLDDRFGDAHEEPGYVPVRPRLMVEQMLITADGRRPTELRLFVFDGVVAVVNTVFVARGRLRNGAFHTPDWVRLDWHFSRFVDREFPRPRRLAEIIAVAEVLGAGIDHVRVDVYDCGDRFYVGELSLYSWSGLSRFNPDEADRLLGDHWRLRRPVRRAIASVLLRRRAVKAT